LVGIITAGLGFAGTYLSTYRRYQEDVPLREKRTQYYTELWKCLGTFKQQVTHKELNEFSDRLNNWYNGEGGLFFSQNSTILLEDLRFEIAINVNVDKIDEPVPGDAVRRIFMQVEKLRSTLAKDIGTRRTTRLKELFGRLKELFGILRGHY
jgi:hypothetical protein